MLFQKTEFPGLILIEPRVFHDQRGYFMETYSRQRYAENGIDVEFVQDNLSVSTYGTIRGLHYQNPPYAQSKLVMVSVGTILDVAVDLRKGSPTYGQVFTVELSSTNFKQLFIPQGFAHGFSVLSENATVTYKCDNYYNKESEGGIRYSDASLKIDWQIPNNKALVSDKDLALPLLDDDDHAFHFLVNA